jgi:RHS repeat-associated protein
MVDPNAEYSEAWRVPLGAAGASSPPPVFGFENRRGRDPLRLGITRQFLGVDAGTGLGNYLLAVPILDLPGRNLDLRLNLYHNSNVWRLGQSANGPYLYFDYDKGFPAPGWSLGFGQFYIDGQGYYWLQDADGTLHRMAMRSGIWPDPGLHTIDGTLIDMPLVDGQFNAQYPDGRTVIYGAFNPVGGYFYPVEIVDANGNVISIQYMNGAGPAIQEIRDTLGRVISFYYDANNLLTAVTAPGPDGATRTVVRFHYAPLNLVAPSPNIVVSPAQGIDAIYFPGTSTGYWFGDGDSYTQDSGIIAKVSQRRAMILEAGSLNEQGTVTAGAMTRERRHNYDPTLQAPDLPTYTTMTESWAGMDMPPAVTTYTVTPGPTGASPYPWVIETVRPDGSKVSQGLNDDLSLNFSAIYDSTGNELRLTNMQWEQGDYESPCIYQIEEFGPLGFDGPIKLTVYSYSSPTNQLKEVRAFEYAREDVNPSVLRKLDIDYVTDPGYASRHIFNLPAQVVMSGPDGVAALRSDYEYDFQELADAPGVVGHSDPGTNYRGNITQITRFADAANNANEVIEFRRYDICGNIITRSGQPYDQVTYTYDLGTQYAYPSAVTWGSADPASSARLTRSFTYDFGTGLLLTSTDPNGQITQYASDPATLRLQQMTLPAGGYTLYSYDDADMQISQSVWAADGKPAGETVTLFNGLGLVQQAETSSGIGPLGYDSWNAVTMQYDSMGRIWKRSQPYVWLARGSSPVWTVFSYDGLGRITSVQDPDGRQWTWYYDEPQLPDSASSDVLGETVRVQSPAITWLGKTVNGADRWHRTAARGMLAEVVQPNAYGTWPGGSVFDPGSVKTSYSCNALGLLVQVTQGPQGQQRTFRYDSLGRLTAQYVPEKSMTLDDTGTYVGPGNLARWSDFFTYDNRSNLTSHTDARGVQTLYTYAADPLDPPDPLNRLYHVSYESLGADPDIVPTAPIDYDYSGWGDVTLLVQVSTSPIASSQAIQDYFYDAEGRLIISELSWWTLSRQLAALDIDYAYDSLNRLTGMTYPAELGIAGRKNISYSYDTASGLLASLQIDGADYASGLIYDPAGRFASLTVGPAGPQQKVETYGYDPATGLLTSQQIEQGGNPLFELGYTYWPNRQLYQLYQRTENGTQRFFSYFYDSIDRLRTMSKPPPLPGTGPVRSAPARLATPPPASNTWFDEYTFDEYGNRTAVTANVFPLDGLPSLTYDPKTNHVTTTGFAYDEAGNLTRGQRPDGSWLRYQYDQAGRLATVTDDSGQPLESYGYGADGTRLVTTQAGNSTYCLWDRGKIVAEYAQVTATELAWTRSRFYLGSRILASFMPAQPGQSGEAVYYHHPDRLGTCLITNNADNTFWEQATLPFGTLSPFSTPNPVNPIFTTYDRSPATGLDYAVNRNYDPALRFMQPDPVVITNLRDPRSLNLYSYVRNDPINKTDPAGLQDGGLVSDYDPGEGGPGWIDFAFLFSGLAGLFDSTPGTPGAGKTLRTAAASKASPSRRPPDFLTLSAGFNSDYLFGITASLALTNDWKLYFGIGPTLGVPGGGGSLTGGWILTGSQPPSEKVNSFVQGPSVGASLMVPLAGLGPAVGVEMGDPSAGSWSDWSNYAIEPGIGVGTPSGQVQATYSFYITDLSTYGDVPYGPSYDPGYVKDFLRRLFGPPGSLPPVDVP